MITVTLYYDSVPFTSTLIYLFFYFETSFITIQSHCIRVLLAILCEVKQIRKNNNQVPGFHILNLQISEMNRDKSYQILKNALNVKDDPRDVIN